MDTETAAASLPDDLLAVVLGRVPARSLAASRGVCTAWRDLIDERHLLLRFLLPHSVRGLFINYQDYRRSHFLSRPTPTSSPEYDRPRHRIDAKFDFIEREAPYSWYEVADHCNGLVLLMERGPKVLHVCNPATRWSARLPPCPAVASCHYTAWDWLRRAFLVFDPFVSPEYRVLLSPAAEPERKQMEKDDACRLMEWPPSPWKSWYLFSSSTGWWEEKVLVREGEAAGTVGDLLLYKNQWGHRVEPPCRYAAYWKGALYVHWRGEFVSRLSLLDDKYIWIKSPVQLDECKNDGVQSYLGRSEKGVYIAAIAIDDAFLVKLRVWTLRESGDQTEWVPKSNLKINTYSWSLENNKFSEPKYWTLDLEQKYWMSSPLDNGRKNQDVSLEQNVCWNSDDDNIVDVSDDQQEGYGYVKFLGFHPYKDSIFLCCDDSIAVAFHLNSPKVQYLGTVENHRSIRESFVYTPCLIGDY